MHLTRHTPLHMARFGWSAKKPPEFQVKLRKKDFKDFEALIPKKAFVAKVADKLVGDKDEDPRFFYIPNIKKTLRSQKRVRQFQENLMKGIVRYFKKQHPHMMQPQLYPVPEKPVSEKKLNVMLSTELFDGYNKNHYEMDGATEWYSLKSLHMDQPRYLVSSLSYGPIKNVKNGNLRLVDLRQMARDKGKESLFSVLEKGALKTGLGAVVLPKYDKVKNLKPYTLELENTGLVFFSNTYDAGLLHGPTMPAPINKTKPVERKIYYVAHKVQFKSEVAPKNAPK